MGENGRTWRHPESIFEPGATHLKAINSTLPSSLSSMTSIRCLKSWTIPATSYFPYNIHFSSVVETSTK